MCDDNGMQGWGSLRNWEKGMGVWLIKNVLEQNGFGGCIGQVGSYDK